MPGSAKTLTVVAIAALVLVSAYSVALGDSGLLWFGWFVLVLLAVGSVTTRES